MLNNLSLKDLTAIYEDTTDAMIKFKNGMWTIETPEATYKCMTGNYANLVRYQLRCEAEVGAIELIDSISLEPVSIEDAEHATRLDGVEDNRVYLSF